MSSFRRKKDSIYVILKTKYSFRWESNPRSMGCEASDLPLSHLTCWWMGIKNSVFQVHNTLFTSQSGIRNCHKMTNCEQFRTKCCVKISATLTLASTHVFLIRMCQECYNRRESWVFYFFPRVKWVEILWRQFIIIENRRNLLYQ